MEKMMLLGDEAIGQAAIDAGLSGIYAYPGTPSTEITEYVQASREAEAGKIRSQWSANEKTAYETALGMSYAGKRTMVCMKHVGLNVAMDPFINSAVTGINGGLILAVADDPSMHSSQNEQDSRYLAKFAMVPVLEPSNQQEAYDMVHYGYELSEKYKVPVMVRITTRLAHSRSGVRRKEPREQNRGAMPGLTQFILLPALAREKYKNLLEKQAMFLEESEKSRFNRYTPVKGAKRGIIATGLAYNYLLENMPEESFDSHVLKIAQYPMPVDLIGKIYENSEELLVLEEGYPLVEESIKGLLDLTRPVHGRLDGTLPRDGELDPDLVLEALGGKTKYAYNVPGLVTKRPPALCKGCGHADTFLALNEAIASWGKGRVFSDIGCYTLGALPPFNAINSCVDMGASVTMAKGAADAGMHPSACVIGDSTFTHSGMTGLLDAVHDRTPVTVIISDNSTTAMTGGQESAGTGRLVDICKGLGVEKDHIHVLNPLKKHHGENVRVLKEELAYRGVSVVITQRECIQTARKKKKAATAT